MRSLQTHLRAEWGCCVSGRLEADKTSDDAERDLVF